VRPLKKPTILIILLFPAFLFAHGFSISSYTNGVENSGAFMEATAIIPKPKKEAISHTFYSLTSSKFDKSKAVDADLVYLPLGQEIYSEKNIDFNIDLLSPAVGLEETALVTPSKSDEENINNDQLSILEISNTKNKINYQTSSKKNSVLKVIYRLDYLTTLRLG